MWSQDDYTILFNTSTPIVIKSNNIFIIKYKVSAIHLIISQNFSNAGTITFVHIVSGLNPMNFETTSMMIITNIILMKPPF